jgi:hypothetical protein
MTTLDKKEAAIRTLHAYKDQLLLEIEQKQNDLKSVKRSIELLSGDITTTTTTMTTTAPLFDVSEPPVSRYSGLGKQAAVELFLKENNKRWYKSSVVAKELIRRGMNPTTKNWGPAVTNSLNRATSKGLAKKEKRNGVFMYRGNTETEMEEEA